MERAGPVREVHDGVYQEVGTCTLGVVCYNERTMHDAGFLRVHR